MDNTAKLLIAAGAALILAGLFFQFGGRSLSLGRLPGDIAIERDGFKFFVPLTTSLLLSGALSLLFWLFQRFLGK